MKTKVIPQPQCEFISKNFQQFSRTKVRGEIHKRGRTIVGIKFTKSYRTNEFTLSWPCLNGASDGKFRVCCRVAGFVHYNNLCLGVFFFCCFFWILPSLLIIFYRFVSIIFERSICWVVINWWDVINTPSVSILHVNMSATSVFMDIWRKRKKSHSLNNPIRSELITSSCNRQNVI